MFARRFSKLLVAEAVCLLVWVGAPALASSSALRWHREPLHGSAIPQVSCARAALCAVLGGDDNVYVSTNPTRGRWRDEPLPAQPGSELVAISCPSVSLCVIADAGTDSVYVSTDPAVGEWHADPLPTAGQFPSLGSISCPSTNLCVLSSDSALFISGDPAAGQWTAQTAGAAQSGGLGDVSCPTTTFCAASGGQGNIYVTADPQSGAWEDTHISDTSAFSPFTVSCASASLCIATDQGGETFVSTDLLGGVWNSYTIPHLPFPRVLGEVTCPSSSFCAAADPVHGDLWDSTEPTRDDWHPVRFGKSGDLADGVDCPTVDLCIVVGGNIGHSLVNDAVYVGSRPAVRPVPRRHKPASSPCPAVQPAKPAPHSPSLTLSINSARGEYFASGSGWSACENVAIYLDTAEGATYIGAARATHKQKHGGWSFGPQAITDFLPAITEPGDSEFASSEDYPVVAMGTDGDAATISDPYVTEAEVVASPSGGGLRFFRSSKYVSPTIDRGCGSKSSGFGFNRHRATVVRIQPGTGLMTDGASIVYRGERVRLASVNWYGAEEADFVPGGLQCASLRTIAKEIRGLGFNSVRLPWSNAMFELDPEICTQRSLGTLAPCIPPQVLAANPGLKHPGESAREIFAATVHALTRDHLMVILDNHGTDAAFESVKADGQNLDGLWWGGQFWDNEYGYEADVQARTQHWINDWAYMAKMFSSDQYVIGADLRNEPSTTPYGCGGQDCTPQWGSDDAAQNWLGAATQAGNAILSVNVNPRLLIFVEGTGYALDLHLALTNPVNLSESGRVVYSAHSYPSDGPIRGHYFGSGMLDLALTGEWGLVAHLAPVWIGEFGADTNKIISHARCSATPLPLNENQWLKCFAEYLSGARVGWSWWAINGTESDGGIFNAGRTYYEREGYGLLSTSWRREASAPLIHELQRMQH